MHCHQPTKDYVARRTAEGKTKAEILRCLKRYIACEAYPLLAAQCGIRIQPRRTAPVKSNQVHLRSSQGSMNCIPHDLRLADAAGWLETEGALLDGLVSDTSISDWQAVVDLVRSVGWWYDYEQDGCSCRLPSRAQDIFALRNERATVLHVRPVPDVLVNFYFLVPDSIDFDLDPKELQSQMRLDVLCQFIRSLGRNLRKPVLPGLEGCLPDRPSTAYDPGSGCIQLA